MIDAILTHGDAILLKDGDRVINMVTLAKLLNNSYIIPSWCELLPADHFTPGGCLAVSNGHVAGHGGNVCRSCKYADESVLIEAIGDARDPNNQGKW